MFDKRKIWNRDYERRDKQRLNARAMTNTYHKRGLIQKVKCEICSSKDNLEFHHPDYNFWRVVKVLCKKCHLALHKQIKCALKKDKLGV